MREPPQKHVLSIMIDTCHGNWQWGAGIPLVIRWFSSSIGTLRFPEYSSLKIKIFQNGNTENHMT
jgi:hypothetical protein